MRKVVVTNHMTLDGVMQSPSGPEEDARDGFVRGGWAAPNVDDVLIGKMGEGMGSSDTLLFGRRTYEHFAGYWPHQTDGNPYTEALNRRTKYVASSTLSEPLPWENSILLSGDVPAAVAALKQQQGKDVVILGSGQLIGSLMAHNLIDEFLLMIHPVVLGSGRRLFPDGGPPAAFELVDSTPTTTGVIIATYRLGEAR
jgi:dihydrofolate reductase